MDPSLLLMLSSLMQLQNTFEPSSSSINDNNAPLLFFMLAAALCHAAAIYSHKTPNSDDDDNNNSDFNATNTNLLYNNLIISDRMRALDPHLRDTQFRTTYGLSYPLFTALLEQLKPYIPPHTINMPLHSALAMVLHRLSQGHSARAVASPIQGRSMDGSQDNKHDHQSYIHQVTPILHWNPKWAEVAADHTRIQGAHWSAQHVWGYRWKPYQPPQETQR